MERRKYPSQKILATGEGRDAENLQSSSDILVEQLMSEEERKKMRSLSAFTIIASFIALLFIIYLLAITVLGVDKSPINVIVPNHLKVSNNPILIQNQATQQILKDIHTAIPQINLPPKQSQPLITINDAIEKKDTSLIKKSVEQDLQKKVDAHIEDIRRMKANGVVIETDEDAKKAVEKLQTELKQLIPLRYGHGPYYVEMTLVFPETMADYKTAGKDGKIIIELAPMELVPYSIYYFMELVRQWKGGAFHRFAGHVAQAMIYKSSSIHRMAFQEYHPDFPHKILTLGYAGRPGGPEFYISTQDNVENHGPGSQGSKTEADGCFGKIYRGVDVVERIKKVPGTVKPMGFIQDSKNFIEIPMLRLLSEQELLGDSPEAMHQTTVDTMLENIRSFKARGIVLEEDENAKQAIASVQQELKQLIQIRYGPGPYYVEMKLTFPETMPDFTSAGAEGIIIIELAPIDLVPYSVFYFMELVRNWKGGAFHRNAGHVLQSMIDGVGKIKGLAFQEYHPSYPHKKLTMGYAGRPGGPAFYISTQDNSVNHGPGSQGSKTEADSCFGRIYKGEDVVERMKLQPGKSEPMGFVKDHKNYINIPSMKFIKIDEL